MNASLVKNWNRAVGNTDIVYVFGRYWFWTVVDGQFHYWLGKLNGKIYFIRGNHDTDIITRAKVITDQFPIKYKGHEFLLMHDPYRPVKLG